ncbi:DUF4397 domain-containing protein [Flavobacterium sp. RHBU_3]|uniref:DUF4397 domain-containing protein n=1 Tax=Flavobacterium sp. RHBU_3 TaxID=3391184 RepID=UPI0039852C1A
MNLKFFSRMLLGIAVALLATSCLNDDDNYYNPYPNVAYGVIVNASPESGDLFFFADQNQINNNALNYSDAAGYYNFYTGSRVLSLKNSAGETLSTDDITLNNGDFFSAFAVNTFENVELVTYRDSLEYPASGTANVRFINLAPDAASVDISGTTATFATGVDFKEATDFMSVASGTYDITFKDSASGETIYTATALDFANGGIYTVYTQGFVSPAASSNDTFTVKKLRNY